MSIDKALAAAGGIALAAWAATSYPLQTLVLVLSSLAMAGASLWSCRELLGARSAWTFAAIAAALGWFAEEMGSTRGWFFGHYTYTDVLGPRLGSVPIVIPLMWFGLAHIGALMASLLLWRTPVPPAGGWKTLALAAFLAALLVTAFDLAADPYFVYQLKAWIMKETDGDWFGETMWGFAGWMTVSFTIVALFLAVDKPKLRPGADAAAALVPVLVYGALMLFQAAFSERPELRVIPLFAMGIPLLVATVAWSQWRRA
ncbi:MAG: carotenoid biosynthesis protein [Burkholderiales bacterium]|nr:carotenoid biosynthesis protein [Burkholderiales bacterium]